VKEAARRLEGEKKKTKKRLFFKNIVEPTTEEGGKKHLPHSRKRKGEVNFLRERIKKKYKRIFTRGCLPHYLE